MCLNSPWKELSNERSWVKFGRFLRKLQIFLYMTVFSNFLGIHRLMVLTTFSPPLSEAVGHSQFSPYMPWASWQRYLHLWASMWSGSCGQGRTGRADAQGPSKLGKVHRLSLFILYLPCITSPTDQDRETCHTCLNSPWKELSFEPLKVEFGPFLRELGFLLIFSQRFW